MPKNTLPRRTSAPKQPKTKPAAERPDWLNQTPEETVADPYKLEMWDANTVIQEIGLSRDEYIVLKDQLAKMRGYSVRAEATHAR